MARRKRLIGIETLNKASELLAMGVPLAKIHTSLGLDKVWSYQSTSDVLAADRDGLHSVTRPGWLQDTPLLQETPTNWHFEGTFPYGEWYKDSEPETKDVSTNKPTKPACKL